MRIVGIDPGLRLTGYGCVELPPNAREPSLVEAGVLRLDTRATLASRLHQLHDELGRVFDDLSPARVCVEQLFSHYKHHRTAIIMGHARGVVLLAARQRHIDVSELMPNEIKKSITGHGHATKRQMQLAVMAQCNLPEPPEPPDVADAIAIALCAARRGMPATATHNL